MSGGVPSGRRESDEQARGWRAFVLSEDDEQPLQDNDVKTWCSECAAREFDGDWFIDYSDDEAGGAGGEESRGLRPYPRCSRSAPPAHRYRRAAVAKPDAAVKRCGLRQREPQSVKKARLNAGLPHRHAMRVYLGDLEGQGLVVGHLLHHRD